MATSTNHLNQLEWLERRLASLTLSDAVAALSRLVHEPTFWRSQIWPLLDTDTLAMELTIARSLGAQNSGAMLQLFVWPPGAATQIHDHSCWGALHCVVGSVWEERYERLDDGGQLDVARLRQAWARPWMRLDGVTTFLPYEAGIHRLDNPGQQVAISAHIYGPRLAPVDGRDYNPTCDYVCDRFEE